MHPIGIYGGTFDPVHFGHLRTAVELREALGLAEMRLLPACRPPHRDDPAATPEQRREMLELALAGVPGLTLDDRELRRDGPSYMVDTLASLREELGGRPLCLILGMDAFALLDTWHQWQRLVELAHLVVMERPGGRLPGEGPVRRLLEEHRTELAFALREHPAGRVLLQPVSQLEISASRIRALARAGHDLHFLLPEAVREYVERERLYRDGR